MISVIKMLLPATTMITASRRDNVPAGAFLRRHRSRGLNRRVLANKGVDAFQGDHSTRTDWDRCDLATADHPVNRRPVDAAEQVGRAVNRTDQGLR